MPGLRGSGASPDTGAKGLADVAGSRVFVDVTIPRTKVVGKMRLATRSEMAQIRAAARKFLGLPLDANALLGPGMMEDWLAELAIRTLAVVVCDPANTGKPLDDLEAWREQLDDDQIGALHELYKDLGARLDPLGPDAPGLSEIEHDQLVSALKKKDVDLLSAFGSRKLSAFLISTVAPPAS